MMIDMIESIMSGENQYPAALKVSKDFWDKFFAEHSDDDDSELKQSIESAQLPYQWAVEKVGLTAPYAKSIMVMTCIGALYNDGFENISLAKRVIKAFASTKTMSLGIGSSAKEVAALYSLDKD